jgi:hypothetical protein
MKCCEYGPCTVKLFVRVKNATKPSLHQSIDSWWVPAVYDQRYNNIKNFSLKVQVEWVAFAQEWKTLLKKKFLHYMGSI